jgi:ribonuclease BN (tRNA processing enzyme)
LSNLLTIQLLGTGTILSNKQQLCSSALLQYRNTIILVDAGPGTMYRLKQIKLSPAQIDHIFFTHFHPDHIADVIPLLFWLKNLPTQENQKILKISGPEGLQNFFQTMELAYGSWMTSLRKKIRVEELLTEENQYTDFRLRCKKLKHSEESIGYRFGFEDKIITIPGDTGYCPELVDICYQADLVLLECSFPDEAEVQGHLSPSLAGMVAQHSKAKRIVLTHIYPVVSSQDSLKIIKKHYNGSITIGRDLDKFKI